MPPPPVTMCMWRLLLLPRGLLAPAATTALCPRFSDLPRAEVRVRHAEDGDMVHQVHTEGNSLLEICKDRLLSLLTPEGAKFVQAFSKLLPITPIGKICTPITVYLVSRGRCRLGFPAIFRLFSTIQKHFKSTCLIQAAGRNVRFTCALASWGGFVPVEQISS